MTKEEASLPQPMCPHGGVGVVFGKLMDLLNRRAHKFALHRLDVQRSDRILEIGFGTGQLIGMLAKAATEGLVAGVDPSKLMVETARKRNARLITRGGVDLREGTASSLSWQDGAFDKAAALHSFQFWRDPVRDLREVARVIRPGGLLLLILRAHDKRCNTGWLSNPLSRGGDEVQATLITLAGSGFEHACMEDKVAGSQVVTAIRARG